MYQVLYRKYRPKTFSDVVGQPHITSTLKNEIISNRHSHAYLFTGSRGTGKTSCAKILAKAVNCLNPINGDPCGECSVCKGIDSGAIMDVIEIDAASNNGVDNIRDIRQESNFAPASCKYRVYIIDEVHMLSAGAFNALLKTLEEPPEHVKFILATTEVHKLPATILSRCQRFDFRRIPMEDMVERMMYIATQEGTKLTNEGAMLISRIADGGMRDALSLLDQCIGTGEEVTSELVSHVAGLTSKAYLFRLGDAIVKSDSAEAMAILDELHSSSCDMERLCTELINHFRALMVVKTVGSAENILVCTKEEFQQTVEQSRKFSLEKILYTLDLLQDAIGNMKRGVNKRIEMEMAIIKLSGQTLKTDAPALLKRIADLENAVKHLNLGSTSNNQAPLTKDEEKTTEPKQDEAPPKPENSVPLSENGSSTALSGEEAKELQEDIRLSTWPEILEEIKKVNMPFWAVLNGSEAYIHGDFVLVDCPNETFGQMVRQSENSSDMRKAIISVTGRKYRLGIYKRKDSELPKTKDPLDNLIEKMRSAEIKIDNN